MKRMLVFALFLLSTAGTAFAQLSLYAGEFPKKIIGKWVVLDEKTPIKPKSISFFEDGIINLEDSRIKRVQRYKVSEAEKGYKVEILELVNGSPVSAFNILSLTEKEMELTYELNSMQIYVKLKKASDKMQFLPAKDE
jgi:hypothetical protein